MKIQHKPNIIRSRSNVLVYIKGRKFKNKTSVDHSLKELLPGKTFVLLFIKNCRVNIIYDMDQVKGQQTSESIKSAEKQNSESTKSKNKFQNRQD